MASSSSSHQNALSVLDHANKRRRVSDQSSGLESMASSSSSHQNALSVFDHANKRRRVSDQSSTLYDVFINHRGPDCKGTLATQLYKSFEQLGIKAFLDSKEKELGTSFPSTIETTIPSAKAHIAIFSPRYAESPWCLEELVLMVQSKAKIIPVFYKVKPYDLRHIREGKGAYAEAFFQHKKKGRYPEEKLNAWKDALESLSLVAGEEFSEEGDCQSIVEAARKEVQANTFLDVADHPVGLDKLVQDFENQFGQKEIKLLINLYKARVVPIFGMGGIGKTTLAKELFNQKKSNYLRTSFLFDVREAHATGNLPSLQCKLLKDLFNDERRFTSIEEGKSYLKDRLRMAPLLRALVVVDDINHVDQLNALAVMDISNKSTNSLVIVTTRDAGVLISAGITDGYNLKEMNSNYATELFCWHAFCEDHPPGGYEMLVKEFVDVCGGLPLSLQVLGRHVRGRPHEYWSSALDKVKKALPWDVKQRLRISFDTLDEEEKQVFMDVACFFLGKPKSMAERVWEGSGWSGQHALETLKDRCLVEEKEIFSIFYNQTEIVLRMHDHLRDLGREMARDREFSSPSRLRHPQDLKSLELMGFKSILAKTNIRCFHTIFDESIGCKVTFFLGHSNICVETPASLLWLQLEGNTTELPSIPPWIPFQNLQCLQIKSGRFKTLWENQAPPNLKELLISQTRLKEIPKLSGISDSLENVFLDAQNWPIQGLSLIEYLSMDLSSICLRFSRLEGEQVSVKTGRTFSKSLVIVNFKLDGEVNWNDGGISASFKAPASGLEKLEISYGKFLTKILICGIHCPRLESIKLDAVDNLMEVNLSSMKTLNCLEISRCLKIQTIIIDSLSCMEKIEVKTCEKLQSITIPTALVDLFIHNCRNLQRVSGTGDLMELEGLIVMYCPELEELPSLSKVSCMNTILIYSCERLESITLPTELFTLSIKKCRNLQRVSGMDDLMEIEELTVRVCSEFKELPSLSKVICIKDIIIEDCERLESITLPTALVALSINNCRNLQRVSGTGDLMELEELTVEFCPELEELPSLSKVSCMKNIMIFYCERLESITLPTTLFALSIEICRNLQRVSGMDDLMALEELTVRNCPELKELPSLSKVSCMKDIIIDDCERLESITLPTTLVALSIKNCRNLQRMSGTGDLMELQELTVRVCPKLEELPSLSKVSCMKNIVITNCEKLEKIVGIEEMHALKFLTLDYCSHAIIRSCIHKLKSLPSRGMMMIGKAVDAAESILNEDVFSEAHIGAALITDGTQYSGDGPLSNRNAFIDCYLVVVDSLTGLKEMDYITEFLGGHNQDYEYCHNQDYEHYDDEAYYFNVYGKLIVTRVQCCIDPIQDRSHYLKKIDYLSSGGGMIKRRFHAEMKSGEEWRIMDLLRRIVDKIYYL